ncbi:hypothetical protein ACFPVX_18000 [Cohnella faecalis]|uniref:Phage tail tape measure protein n=1 Tax=Cohnella faecalis TaxID=2315694 RepID=A0A398CK94_9BACL|nr:hypothetical protein [Cohnella faecalis]RIE01298.1 hypothetical protein D3H35_23225 [Cohnella faecalis]
MATVSSSLQMFAQVSQTLNRAQKEIQRALGLARRLQQQLQQRMAVEIDTSGALSQLDGLKDRLESSFGETVVFNIFFDTGGIVQDYARVQQLLQTNLPVVEASIELYSEGAILDAEEARERIRSVTGQFWAIINVGPPEAGEIRTRLLTVLQVLNPAVTVRLVFDEIAANEQLHETINRIASTEASVKLTIDIGGVLAEVEQLRQHIASSGFSSIRVVLDRAMVEVALDSTQALSQAASVRVRIERQIGTVHAEVKITAVETSDFRNQIRTRLKGFTVKIKASLDTSQALAEMSALRGQLMAGIGSIRTTIQIQLPAALTVMFTNIQRLVMRLIAAVGRLRSAGIQLNGANRSARQSQDTPNQQKSEGKSEAGGLQARINGLLSAYQTLQDVGGFLSSSFGGAMDQLNLAEMFKAGTGSGDIGTAMFEKFKADAMAAGQDVNESLKGTLSFFSITQNTDQLTKLNSLANRLSAFDLEGGGIESAANVLKEAMSGDVGALSERFNMPQSSVQSFKIEELAKAGDMDGFLSAFDQLMEKQNMGQAAFDGMMDSPAKQMEALGNNMKTTLNDVGAAALTSLAPLIDKVNEFLQSGQITDFITNNWSAIETAIIGVTSALALWKIATIASNVALGIQNLLTTISAARSAYSTGATLAQVAATELATGAQIGFNAALLANPMTWIVIVIIALIAGIVLLVRWLINLWNTNDQFAGGLMQAWNMILNFFDQIPIFFTMVGNGIVNAFQSAGVLALQAIEAMINGAIDAINWLSETSNKILGTNFQIIQPVQISVQAEARAKAIKQAGIDEVNKMKQDAAAKAASREADRLKMLDDRKSKRALEQAEKAAKEQEAKDKAAPPDFSKWNQSHPANLNKAKTNETNGFSNQGRSANINRVNEVGTIGDKVEISSEDLKAMRELAEMKNIQNFVNLTPQISFGETHVRNESDIGTIITGIKSYLEEEFSSSVQGVYG